jgi:hypothetical protein
MPASNHRTGGVADPSGDDPDEGPKASAWWRGGAATLAGEGGAMEGFFRLPAAGALFFVSAWLLMIFAGIVASDVGIRPFGYITSMVVTIGLWLTLAPAIGAIARTRKKG